MSRVFLVPESVLKPKYKRAVIDRIDIAIAGERIRSSDLAVYFYRN